jgi:hypothetical protein
LKECSELRVCEHLLEVVQKQEETIVKQNELIAKLVNENFEQENFIAVLMKEQMDDITLSE